MKKAVLVGLTCSLSPMAISASISTDAVLAGALACTEAVLEQPQVEQAQHIPGKISISSVPYEEAVEIQVGTAYSRQARTQYIPVVETTYLDGPAKGSAWRECMHAKALPTPRLTSE